MRALAAVARGLAVVEMEVMVMVEAVFAEAQVLGGVRAVALKVEVETVVVPTAAVVWVPVDSALVATEVVATVAVA